MKTHASDHSPEATIGKRARRERERERERDRAWWTTRFCLVVVVVVVVVVVAAGEPREDRRWRERNPDDLRGWTVRIRACASLARSGTHARTNPRTHAPTHPRPDLKCASNLEKSFLFGGYLNSCARSLSPNAQTLSHSLALRARSFARRGLWRVVL